MTGNDIRLARRKLRRWFSSKWRWMVILAFFVSGWIITIYVYHKFGKEIIKGGLDDLAREVFVAWSGGLVFFTIVGLAVTLASIEKPVDPSQRRLRERVGFLFGRDDIPDGLLTYSMGLFHDSLAQYSRLRKETITILEYNKELNAFYHRKNSRTVIANALMKEPLSSVMNIHLQFDQINPSRPSGRVNSIKVDGREMLSKPHVVLTGDFNTPFQFTIEPDGQVDFEMEYEAWSPAGQLSSFKSVRFIEHMIVEFINRLDFNPSVYFDSDNGKRTLQLIYNVAVLAIEGRAVQPNAAPYEWMIDAQQETAASEH